MDDKRQLLCTFSSTLNYKDVINKVNKFYIVYKNKYFVFYNTNNNKELFITYNIIGKSCEAFKFPGTISIHRKKQTNTLFTLNSLNALIKEENEGILNKSFKVNWEYYKDSFIITGDISVRIIPIKIYTIVDYN